ncbi:hypothetical protein ACQ4M3_20585 [Leptolyngbya sp. AN03gr2]|uniref:hypothetical protein n=1 Tax=unclassified Leptolyngbya TaxID=2650499 RepID=UPI003D31FEA5
MPYSTLASFLSKPTDPIALPLECGDRVWTKGILDFKANAPFIPWVKGTVEMIQQSECTLKCPRRRDRSCSWITVHYMQPVLDRTFRLIDPKYRQSYATQAKTTGGFISGKKHIKACELWSNPPTRLEPIAEFPGQIRQSAKKIQTDGFPAETKLLQAEKLLRNLVKQTMTEITLGNLKKAAQIEDQCEEIIEAVEQFAKFHRIKIDGSESVWVLYPLETETTFCNLAPIQPGEVYKTRCDHRDIQIKNLTLNYHPERTVSELFQIELVGLYGNNEIRFTSDDLTPTRVDITPLKPNRLSKFLQTKQHLQYEQLSLFSEATLIPETSQCSRTKRSKKP